MRTHLISSWAVNHSLTPKLERNHPILDQYDIPQVPRKREKNIERRQGISNMNLSRSKKTRIFEEKNTEIERSNRILYQKIRKIKLKNTYRSEKKLDADNAEQDPYMNTTLKQLSLPQVHSSHQSMMATKSELKNILQDRKTFVDSYFKELDVKAKRGYRKIQELGQTKCNGWKIAIYLLDDEAIALTGNKGKRQLTKKYSYARVRNTGVNLEQWARSKFQFEV